MVDVAPLYTDQSPLSGSMPLLSPDTRSAPFWSSQSRPISSTVTEVCEVRLHGPRLVNYIRASVPHFPHEARLEYWDDAAEAWTSVHDSYLQPVLNRVFDSKPMRIAPSTFQSTVQHPMHQGDNHWISLSWKVPAITAQRWRFLLKRLPGIGPIDASTGNALNYPLGLQDIDLGYRVFTDDDIPTGATETPGFASSLDYLGSRVEYGVRRLDASQALTTSGVGWRSEPQPVQYGVVNYYVDVRDTAGQAQIIDRFFIDPLTPGVHCNLYYSAEAPPLQDVTTWTWTAADDNNSRQTYPALARGWWKQVGWFTPSSDSVYFHAPPDLDGWEGELDFVLQPANEADWSTFGDSDPYSYDIGDGTRAGRNWVQYGNSYSSLVPGERYSAWVYVDSWEPFAPTALGLTTDFSTFVTDMQAGGTYESLLLHSEVFTEAHYASMEWTPIPRDYILARGYMNLPPTKAAFFKFEFTNLVAEHYEVFVPIDRKVKLFRADTVAEYEGIAKSSSTGPTAGYRAQHALAAYQRYRDAVGLLVAGDAAYPVSPTLALTANNDPDLAARLRRTGWVWNFDPWHVGLGAPRFTKKQVHVYDEAEVSHVSRIGYFVGLKLVQPYKVDPLANEDTAQYDFQFNVTQPEVDSGGWVTSISNGVTYDGDVVTFESAAAQIASRTLHSQRGVRAIQYATVQSPPAQIMPDPDLLQPLFHWGTWGDAAAYSLPTGGIHVQRGYATTFYGNLDDRLYSDLEGMGLYGNVEGASTPTGQFGGGVESVVLVPSALGHITAVATVTTDDVLSGPLTLQIVAENNIVLAETDFWLSQGETVKVKASYDLGTAAPAQPYSTLEVGTYGDLETSTYAELEGTPIYGNVKIRVIQIGTQRNEFSVLRVGVFDDPLVWEFSNDDGLTWWSAPGIRNDPYGVLPFPLNEVGKWPTLVDTFSRPDGSLSAAPVMDSGDTWLNADGVFLNGGRLSSQTTMGGTAQFLPPASVAPSAIEFTLVQMTHLGLTAYEGEYVAIFTLYTDAPSWGGPDIRRWATITDRSVLVGQPDGSYRTIPYSGTLNQTVYQSGGGTTQIHMIEDGSLVRIDYAADGTITVSDDGEVVATFNPTVTDSLTHVPDYRGVNFGGSTVGSPTWTPVELDDLTWTTSVTPPGSSTYKPKLRWRVRGFQEGAWLSALSIRPWYVGTDGAMTPNYGSIIGPNRTPLDHYGPIDNDPMWRAQNNVIDSFLSSPLRGGDGMIGPLSPAGHEPSAHFASVFENTVVSESLQVEVNGVLVRRPIIGEGFETHITSDAAVGVRTTFATASDSTVTTNIDTPIDTITDNFNRPDGDLGGTTTSDGRATWQKMNVGEYAGSAGYLGMEIYSNQLRSNQYSLPDAQVIETGHADGILRLTITQSVLNGTYGYIGFTARYDPVAQTYLRARWIGAGGGSNGRFVITEWHGTANPVSFLLSPYPSIEGDLHAGDVFEFRFRGPRLDLLVNGVVVCSNDPVTSPSLYTTGTQHGVDMNCTSNYLGQDNIADDFVFTALTLSPIDSPSVSRSLPRSATETLTLTDTATQTVASSFTDNFNRSDRDINGDNGWTTDEGTAAIQSNAVVSTALAGNLAGFGPGCLVTRATGLTGTFTVTHGTDSWLVVACDTTRTDFVIVRGDSAYHVHGGTQTTLVTGMTGGLAAGPVTAVITDNGDGTFHANCFKSGTAIGSFNAPIPAGGGLRAGMYTETLPQGMDDFSWSP